MSEIRSAFIGLIEVTAPDRVAAYQDWHATDHLPENLGLAQIVYANRWIAGPELATAREAAEPRLKGAQFLISYFFREPVSEAIEAFIALGARLTDAGRGFADREVVFGRYFDLVGCEVSRDVQISPEALPYRRHRGVLLQLSESASASPRLDRPGVLGCYRFASREAPGHDSAGLGRVGAGLYFLDEDPGRVWTEMRQAPPPGAKTVYSGVFARSQ